MRCDQCGFDNAELMKFCVQCGGALGHRCRACGFLNPPLARFCGQCGTPLDAGPSDGPASTTAARDVAPDDDRSSGATVGVSDPERRQLTVMFCDLVGSTALSARLDPEELREIVQAYQSTCAAVVRRYEGHIAQYLGDGLLVYFGYPRAHEDDATRAGHAGLEILEAMGTLNDRLQHDLGIRLDVRIGIHTGPTVVGDIGGETRHEQLAVGETPNVAARIQGMAPPNVVMMSEATQRLLSGAFIFQDAGLETLAGIARPVRLFRLLDRHRDRQIEGGAPDRLIPLVGRDAELAVLRDAWERCERGHGDAILVRGEAGVGKSRLLTALKHDLAGEPHHRLEGAGSPYHQSSPLFVMMDMFRRWLDLGQVALEERVGRLESSVRAFGVGSVENVALLANLLSVPLNDRYPAITLDPARQRQSTLNLLVTMLLNAAERRPVLVIVEDLHWADPSSLELLTLCIARCRSARLLLLLSSRPEFTPPWGDTPPTTVMNLDTLDRAQSEAMLAAVMGGRQLPSEILDEVVRRTDGIPLFIEETMKAILESGFLRETSDRYELRGPLPLWTIPVTLQDALMARLDRLGRAKKVAQIGSVIGRHFSFGLLQAVSSLEPAALETELTRIVQSGLLEQHGLVPQATYAFKHALVQDAAYQSLLRRARQQYHRRTVAVLEQQFPDIGGAHPELLAEHATAAGMVDEAVGYWYEAGQRAIKRAAFPEAISQFERGLALLATTAESAARDLRELPFQTSLGMALQASRGYAAAEVDRAYTRARMLGERSGDASDLVSVLRGQHLFYSVRADYRTAMGLGTEMLELATRHENTEHRLEAHLAVGLYSIYLGEFVASRTHLEQGIALYRPVDRPLRAFQYVGHSAAICHSYLGRTLSFLGYHDQALALTQQGLTLARDLSIPMSQAQAMGMYTVLAQMRRDVDAVDEWASRTIAYATEYGFPYWSSLCSMTQGWLLSRQERPTEGIEQVRRGLDRYLATGARLGLSWFLALLAETYAATGQYDEGLQALGDAEAHVQATDERYYEAEVLRLKGELLIRRDASGSVPAEDCFQRAIAVARRQHAKSWELRAAMSLARLWSAQGRPQDAYDRLAAVHSWFSEGFDLPDMQDAKRLLDDLSLQSAAAG